MEDVCSLYQHKVKAQINCEDVGRFKKHILAGLRFEPGKGKLFLQQNQTNESNECMRTNF